MASNSGFVVAVRAKPGAKRTRVGGSHNGPHGAALVISVQARALDGAATEAIRRELAKALMVKPSTVSVRLGHTSRDKLFLIDPWPDDIQRRIQNLLEND